MSLFSDAVLGDEGGESIFAGMGSIGDLSPSAGYPVTGDKRQHSSAGQIQQDAKNLRTLGFDAPETGNAYDPKLTAAVTKYQRAVAPRAGVVDGLLGPNTRLAIAQDLAKLLGSANVVPYAPSPSPNGGGTVVPVVAQDEDNTKRNVLIGAGIVAGLGGLYYFLK